MTLPWLLNQTLVSLGLWGWVREEEEGVYGADGYENWELKTWSQGRSPGAEGEDPEFRGEDPEFRGDSKEDSEVRLRVRVWELGSGVVTRQYM